MQADTELTIMLLAEAGRTVAHKPRPRGSRYSRLDVISCADPFYEQLGFGRVSGFRLLAAGA